MDMSWITLVERMKKEVEWR